MKLVLFLVLVGLCYLVSAQNASSSHQDFLPCRPRESSKPSSSHQDFLPCRPRESRSPSSSNAAPSDSTSSSISLSPSNLPSETSTATATISSSSSNTAKAVLPSETSSSSSSFSSSASISASSSSIPSSTPSSTAKAVLPSETSSSSSSFSSSPSASFNPSSTPSSTANPVIPSQSLSASPSASAVPSTCPQPSPTPSCPPSPPRPEVVNINFNGLCCSSSNLTTAPVYPNPFSLVHNLTTINVNFNYDDPLECLPGNCDMELYISDLLNVYNYCPCSSSLFFAPKAHIYYHTSDGSSQEYINPVSNIDLSDASQLDSLFGYVQNEIVSIQSIGYDIDRQTATIVAYVRYDFPKNTPNCTTSSNNANSGDGCGYTAQSSGARGPEILSTMLFVFGQEDCLIDEIVVIPAQNSYLIEELRQVNQALSSKTEFCFKQCNFD